MKFTVSSKELCTRLMTISRIITTKGNGNMAILESILFTLRGGRLELRASDGDNTVTTFIETAESEEDGVFAADPKRLIDSLKEIPEQPITFDVNTETYSIEVLYLNGHYFFIGLDGTPYPPDDDTIVYSSKLEISNKVLANGLASTLFAIGDDAMRPIMNGVFVNATPGMVDMVASDGHKLVRHQFTGIASQETNSFVLPKKPAGFLKGIVPADEGGSSIEFSGKKARIMSGSYCLTCSLIEGRYPNYASVIPSDNPFVATIDHQAFTSAVRRVGVFASESSALISLNFENNLLTLISNDAEFSTNAEEKIMCDYNGSPISIGFSGVYLLEVLNNLKGENICVKLADSSRAGVLSPDQQEENEQVVMILMPLMLNE